MGPLLSAALDALNVKVSEARAGVLLQSVRQSPTPLCADAIPPERKMGEMRAGALVCGPGHSRAFVCAKVARSKADAGDVDRRTAGLPKGPR